MAPSSNPPAVLCVGIAVQDLVFRVDGIVPEPASLGLLAVGALATLRRRRSN